MKARHKATALALLVLSIGCSDDPVGLEGDQLSNEEIQALFSIFSLAFTAADVVPALATAPGGPALTVVSVSETVSVTASCPVNGTIGVSGTANGSFDDATFESDLNYALTLTPSGCTVNTSNGTLTVNGDPNVQFVLDWAFTQTSLSMSGSQTGALEFTSSNGRSGRCVFDLTFNVVSNQTSATSTTTGTVCGVSASTFQAFNVS